MEASETLATPAIARRLPRDVIHHLYQQCNENSRFNLSHACRLWRQALHGHTEFWTNITLHLRKRDPDLKAAYWLERSGQRPLKIEIHSPWRGGEFSSVDQRASAERTIVRLGVVLRGCMDRCQSFSMAIYLRAINILLPICAGYTPMLNSLTIDAIDYPSISASGERPLIPLLAPIDRAVFVSIGSYIPTFTVLGPSVTKLSVDGGSNTEWTSSDILQVFQSCPNLIECDFNLIGVDELNGPLFNGFVPMLRLAVLSIAWVRDVEHILNVLRLPALKSIYLKQVDWTTAAMTALWSVFGTSHALSSVTITDEEADYDESRNIPAPFHANTLALEAVTFFSICGNPCARPILQYIALPNVETLDLASAPFDVVHRLILSSTNLGSLTLYDVEGVPTHSSRTPVTLSALKTLLIHDPSPRMLDFIHAPQLNSLFITCDSWGPTASLGVSLGALVERSMPDLTALYLSKTDITDKELMRSLRPLSKLESLTLRACPTSDAVLRALAVPPSPEQGIEWILPRLKKIDFHGNVGITPQGVIKLFTSRDSMPESRIKGTVSFVRNPGDQDAEALSHFRGSLTVKSSEWFTT
ncbi:hypothetical protein BOTBODRAFT_30905 [Botryobasidium botryosum FD-172 SS1]|uniref:F-box domain-containing protein n=1 Tax=Botryobasidium botryosum (strain FD-172 SS1) TaxID=930990 RepID=A0A067MLD1_BOTB1|nr:hypothetical protein BOTBODRAFT_30905 [Botryobasidium botryosum FD-172 SS1]